MHERTTVMAVTRDTPRNWEEAAAMKAQVGDRLVTDDDDSRRVCEIIGLHHTDGTPPYVVRWFSDGHISLLFPGPYTRVVRGRDGKT
ncbi:MAG TPA: DUF1918 domain-containing protein [Streptosporangiaceae bacterium]